MLLVWLIVPVVANPSEQRMVHLPSSDRVPWMLPEAGTTTWWSAAGTPPLMTSANC